tara:strand:- start:581 stop:1660 length:1080 start_codon:yes stop_codon:yes gene_type:complete
MSTNKVTTNVIDMSDNTGGLTWVKGTTAQRTTSTLGDLRSNTETKKVEIYTDQTGTSEWKLLKEESTSLSVDYLVVAGGGGGGAASGGGGGGGGAGGYLTNFGGTSLTLTAGTYDVEVGTGGTGATTYATAGTNGGNSKFHIYEATGGGGGGGYLALAGNGGSGGGGAGNLGSSDTGYNGGTSSASGQGNAGGHGGGSGPTAGGGGGGAGAVGSNATSTAGGAGGVGLEVNIKGGTGNFYAGGGGGGVDRRTSSTSALGGNGGGGNGASNGNQATAGTNNTGGGGGGSAYEAPTYPGKNGGSGVVIIRGSFATINVSSGVTVNGQSGAGTRNGDTTNMPSGVYFYEITAAGSSDTITLN